MFDLRHGDCLDVLRGMADNSVDAIVTDPPYGLSFMGKRWDYDVPSEDIWRECLRVLKPGGHLLAFAGTRTQHRMAVRIEDAGFEIRDMIAWVYGSGFPKSHDVSKAIDKMDAAEEQQARRYRFTAWVRSQGVTSKQIDEATATNMGGHYTTFASQPAIMTREHLEACRHLFQDIPSWVEAECDKRSVQSRNFAEREVVGHRTMTQGGGSSLQMRMGERREVEANITAPATPAARQWQGWGTALKPALEPITVARKPLIGTVAENVLTWGTGGVNIDGCRVGVHDGDKGGWRPNCYGKGYQYHNEGEFLSAIANGSVAQQHPAGRWPANLIHDGSEDVVGLFPVTNCSARPNSQGKTYARRSMFRDGQSETHRSIHGDSGSAARFFYCAKASKRDRDEGLQIAARAFVQFQTGNGASGKPSSLSEGRSTEYRNFHPTVKPTDLMRYLCRLVTPPNGTVLDPFMGSGSTGKGAILEGFNFIGIEREAEYLDIARARIEHVTKEPNLWQS